MKALKFSVFSLFLVLTLCACGSPEPDNSATDQAGIAARGEKNFASLINLYAQGRPARIPWAGYWWPFTGNGIAAGGRGDGSSPAGKYDAIRKSHAEEWEVQHHGSKVPNVQGWWGHCNGWCAAAALYPEPNHAVTINNNTFSIADIKGLLSEAGMEVSNDFFGNRVDNMYDSQFDLRYEDVFPDQYFLILTNYIGRLKQPVLFDRYTLDQIWNQPFAGYKFEYPTPDDYLGATAGAPNVYRIMVTSTIWWVNDGVSADAQTPPFDFQADGYYFQSRTLRSEIWLDGPVVFGEDGKIKSSGDVILARKGDFVTGGVWRNGEGISADAHPDYMWIPYHFVKPDTESNPAIDFQWIEDHILAEKDDPAGTRDRPRPAPSIAPSSNPSSSPTRPAPPTSPGPGPGPNPNPNPNPVPRPSP